MKAMNEKEKRRILTDEERQQIIEEVGAGMSQKECAKKHDLHPTTVCHVIKQYRQTLAEQANPEPVQLVSEAEEVPEETTAPDPDPARIPPILFAAVYDKIEDLRNRIVKHEYELAKAKQDLAELIRWEEEHNAD